MNFDYTSAECELLLAFESSDGISDLARTLGKDISVVSRNLKAISLKGNVLEKRSGRWHLTDFGIALNNWTKEAIFSQKAALKNQKQLKIAATREFAARILTPNINKLIGSEEINVQIISSDEGIEKLLISGEADFGFDCGRPEDPVISFKRVIDESFSVVAAPKFIERYKIKNYNDLLHRDRLSFSRSEGQILDLTVKSSHYFGRFSDISSLREACVLGFGWAILPTYSVRRELKEKKLKIIKGLEIENQRYGVWWLRERKSISPWTEKAINWLKEQKLT